MIKSVNNQDFKIIAVSNRKLCNRPFLEQIERVCKIHPEAVILREKDLTEEEYGTLAKEVMNICSRYQVSCILHNFWKTALELGCTSVHLPLPILQKITDEEKKKFTKIGISIHSVEEAKEAEQLGASYLTAGHIYATDCKRGLPPRGLGFLKEVCREVSIPVYGIGGIKFDEEQWNDMKKMWSSWWMCYVRNDGNIVIEIKQLIFERAGKPSESVLGRLLLYTGILVHIR